MPAKTGKRIPFTEEDDKLLVKYLAKYNGDGNNRRGKRLWEVLFANAGGKWPWAKRHPAQSWREHYKKDHVRFDTLIARRVQQRYADANQDPLRPPTPPPEAGPSNSQGRRPRQEFTREEELNLVKFLAIENPGNIDRMGNAVYKRLVRNEDELWPWSTRHSWHSWREKYKKRGDEFDEMIANYQKRFKIDPSKDPDTSLWDKLPVHVREEDVKPLEEQLVESDGDEEAGDEDPLQGSNDDAEEVDELASDLDEVESTAEVSQILKSASLVEEDVVGGEEQHGDAEEEEEPLAHTKRENTRSSRSQGSPRATQPKKSQGEPRLDPGRTQEEQENVEEPVVLLQPSSKGKQRAHSKADVEELPPRETSSAPVAAPKKRKLVRRTTSVVERLTERPTKRRRLATAIVNVSDSEG